MQFVLEQGRNSLHCLTPKGFTVTNDRDVGVGDWRVHRQLAFYLVGKIDGVMERGAVDRAINRKYRHGILYKTSRMWESRLLWAG